MDEMETLLKGPVGSCVGPVHTFLTHYNSFDPAVRTSAIKLMLAINTHLVDLDLLQSEKKRFLLLRLIDQLDDYGPLPIHDFLSNAPQPLQSLLFYDHPLIEEADLPRNDGPFKASHHLDDMHIHHDFLHAQFQLIYICDNQPHLFAAFEAAFDSMASAKLTPRLLFHFQLLSSTPPLQLQFLEATRTLNARALLLGPDPLNYNARHSDETYPINCNRLISMLMLAISVASPWRSDIIDLFHRYNASLKPAKGSETPAKTLASLVLSAQKTSVWLETIKDIHPNTKPAREAIHALAFDKNLLNTDLPFTDLAPLITNALTASRASPEDFLAGFTNALIIRLLALGSFDEQSALPVYCRLVTIVAAILSERDPSNLPLCRSLNLALTNPDQRVFAPWIQALRDYATKPDYDAIQSARDTIAQIRDSNRLIPTLSIFTRPLDPVFSIATNLIFDRLANAYPALALLIVDQLAPPTQPQTPLSQPLTLALPNLSKNTPASKSKNPTQKNPRTPSPTDNGPVLKRPRQASSFVEAIASDNHLTLTDIAHTAVKSFPYLPRIESADLFVYAESARGTFEHLYLVNAAAKKALRLLKDIPTHATYFRVLYLGHIPMYALCQGPNVTLYIGTPDFYRDVLDNDGRARNDRFAAHKGPQMLAGFTPILATRPAEILAALISALLISAGTHADALTTTIRDPIHVAHLTQAAAKKFVLLFRAYSEFLNASAPFQSLIFDRTFSHLASLASKYPTVHAYAAYIQSLVADLVAYGSDTIQLASVTAELASSKKDVADCSTLIAQQNNILADVVSFIDSPAVSSALARSGWTPQPAQVRQISFARQFVNFGKSIAGPHDQLAGNPQYASLPWTEIEASLDDAFIPNPVPLPSNSHGVDFKNTDTEFGFMS